MLLVDLKKDNTLIHILLVVLVIAAIYFNQPPSRAAYNTQIDSLTINNICNDLSSRQLKSAFPKASSPALASLNEECDKLGDNLVPAGGGGVGQCPDYNGDGVVGTPDLAGVLGNWGVCNVPGDDCHNVDFFDDGVISSNELAYILGNWGPCQEECVQETPIALNSNNQELPAIYGDRIVWQEFASGWKIHMYDLSTGIESQITDGNYNQYDPAIYGDKIVWTDYRNGNADIYMYDIPTGDETPIITEASGQYDPAIYGDKIVWTDYRNGDFADIYMYDIPTGDETRITDNSSDQYWPAIYGDKIVWQDYRNGNSDIYMYDIPTGDETPLITEASWQYSLAIYGDKIVWQEDTNENGNVDIYMYDLSTGFETQITNNASEQHRPAIYGDKIVWQDYRNGNSDIYMYDIPTQNEIPITDDEYNQWAAAIYGNKIVWQDHRNGNGDIYMYDLDACAVECTEDSDCNDGISCTTGECDALGLCQYTPQDNLCSAEEICDAEIGCVSVSCSEAPQGMVGWYPGDGNANDIANGNNGQEIGEVDYIPGKVDQAFSFNGFGNGYVKVNQPEELAVTSVTMDAWIKPNPQYFSVNAAGDYVMNIYNSYGIAIFKLPSGDFKIACSVETDLSGMQIEGNVEANQWSHIACTYDENSGTLKLYVNGALTDTLVTSANNPIWLTYEDFYIGDYFGGLIDEVEVFNRALTAEEIMTIYQSGSAGKCKVASCGNGIIEEGEQCDYGNEDSVCDGCIACQIVSNECCSGGGDCCIGGVCCGDGICDENLECQPGNICKEDCGATGQYCTMSRSR